MPQKNRRPPGTRGDDGRVTREDDESESGWLQGDPSWRNSIASDATA